jgi:hypothetical protein
MKHMIDDVVENFRVDPSTRWRICENDIDAQIRIMNTDSPETRNQKQASLDSWNIIHGFPEILFKYWKLDSKEYRDICRKRSSVFKGDNIKQLIRSKEMVTHENSWTINKVNRKKTMEWESESWLIFSLKLKWNNFPEEIIKPIEGSKLMRI